MRERERGDMVMERRRMAERETERGYLRMIYTVTLDGASLSALLCSAGCW